MVATKTRILLAASVALVLLGGACAGNDDVSTAPAAQADEPQSGGGGDAGFRGAPEIAIDEGASYDNAAVSSGFADSDGSTGTGQQSAVGNSSLPSLGPSVIKTAVVGVEVARDGLQDAVQDATTTAGRHGGYVVSSAVDRDGRRSASLVIRIPSDRFERALAEIEDLGNVTTENVDGQDVGQEFVDLEARLRNWRSQEAVLLGLMDRATTIEETIRVHNELSAVQLEIERLRGRLRYLGDQTSFGTITAVFEVEGAPVPAKTGRIARAWKEAVDVALRVVSGVIVAAGVILPITILAAIALLLLRQLRPRFERPGA